MTPEIQSVWHWTEGKRHQPGEKFPCGRRYMAPDAGLASYDPKDVTCLDCLKVIEKREGPSE